MDSSSIKPQPVIAEILPGFLFLAILGEAYLHGHHVSFQDQLTFLRGAGAAAAALAGVGGLLASWVAGSFFDSVGNVFEELWDKKSPINWHYLADGPSERVGRINEWFFAYYLLDRNYIVGIIIVGLSGLLLHAWISLPWQVWFILGAALVLQFLDVRSMRKEIRELFGPAGLPHNGVYTRLAPSKHHGVGVFAIRPIKKGTLVFSPDDDETAKVPESTADMSPAWAKRLYEAFCVLRDGEYECPVSFNKLTPAWYVNDSRDDEPNVAPDSELRFRALRDIEASEELLARYKDYSENDPTD